MGKITICSQKEWNNLCLSPPTTKTEIVITKDIKFCHEPSVLDLNECVTLNGNDHVITYDYCFVSGIINLQGGTIKNLKVNGNHKLGNSFLLVSGVPQSPDRSLVPVSVPVLLPTVMKKPDIVPITKSLFTGNKINVSNKVNNNDELVIVPKMPNIDNLITSRAEEVVQYGDIINVHIYNGNLDFGFFGYFFFNFGKKSTKSRIHECSSINVNNKVIENSSIAGFGIKCVNVEFKKCKSVIEVCDKTSIDNLFGYCVSVDNSSTDTDTFIDCSVDIKRKGSTNVLVGYCQTVNQSQDNSSYLCINPKAFIKCCTNICNNGFVGLMFGFCNGVSQDNTNNPQAFVNCKSNIDSTCDATLIIGYTTSVNQLNTLSPCAFIDCCVNIKNNGNILQMVGYVVNFSQSSNNYTASTHPCAFINCKLNIDNHGITVVLVGYCVSFIQNNTMNPQAFIDCCSQITNVGINLRFITGFAVTVNQIIDIFTEHTCAKLFINCKSIINNCGNSVVIYGYCGSSLNSNDSFVQRNIDHCISFSCCSSDIKNNGTGVLISGYCFDISQTSTSTSKCFIECNSNIESNGVIYNGIFGYCFNVTQDDTTSSKAFKECSSNIKNNGELAGITGYCYQISQNSTNKSKAFSKCKCFIKNEGSSQIIFGYCGALTQNECDKCCVFTDCESHIENCGSSDIIMGYVLTEISQTFNDEGKAFINCESCIDNKGTIGKLDINILNIANDVTFDIELEPEIEYTIQGLCGYCGVILQNADPSGASGASGLQYIPDTMEPYGITGTTGTTDTGICETSISKAFIDCCANIKNKGTSYGPIVGYCLGPVQNSRPNIKINVSSFNQLNCKEAIGFVKCKSDIENIGNNVLISGFTTSINQTNNLTEKLFIECKSCINNNGDNIFSIGRGIFGYSTDIEQLGGVDKTEAFYKCCSDITNVSTQNVGIIGYCESLNQDSSSCDFIKCKSNINNTGYCDYIIGFIQEMNLFNAENVSVFIECCLDIDTKCDTVNIYGYCETFDVSKIITPTVFKKCKSNINSINKARNINGFCKNVTVGDDIIVFEECYSVGNYNCQNGSGFIDNINSSNTGINITYLNCYTQIKKPEDCCFYNNVLSGFELNSSFFEVTPFREQNNLIFTNCYNSSVSTDFAFAKSVNDIVTFNNCYCQPNQILYNDVEEQSGVNATINKYKTKKPHCFNSCVWIESDCYPSLKRVKCCKVF